MATYKPYDTATKTTSPYSASCHSPTDNRPTSASDAEKDLLTELVFENHTVLFNKKTDNTTEDKKQEVWMGITERYNAAGLGPKKSCKQLKLIWNHIKRKIQKQNADRDHILDDDDDWFMSNRHTDKTNPDKVLSIISSKLTTSKNLRSGSTDQSPATTFSEQSKSNSASLPQPARQLRKRKRPLSKFTNQNQDSDELMYLKYEEHEQEMKLKNASYQCKEIEKELKTISKKAATTDIEVKEFQVELLKYAIRNKQFKYQTLQKELENAEEKGQVIRMWGSAALALQEAAKAVTEAVKRMEMNHS